MAPENPTRCPRCGGSLRKGISWHEFLLSNVLNCEECQYAAYLIPPDSHA
ncbi:hypothetical protein JMJ58_24120 (plasmid) [Haloterrigena salifodinae]|uniref:Uncharacterized protein n=1 Tax=Haloterrigena salifodinae TaxID=2675099 RepID=A0A8T8E8C6_9EURY|nr:hypothetical protein [Haloterrigena salifodinae]QRV17877.1 hypothetical protein JMJ58_24120 [Haloterrigena salifodinae]